jgi:golgi phosphoprotein 3
MHNKLSIAEEFLLLSLDDEKGVVCNQPFMGLEFGLAGAVLMELSLMGRLKADQKCLTVLDDTPANNPIFDDALAMINQHDTQEEAKYWVWKLGIHIQEIKEYFINHLIDLGILKREEKNFLWIYKRLSYPMIDDQEEREVKERIRSVVLDDEEPLPRDKVLISLICSCNLTGQIFSKDELENAEYKIEKLAKRDVIGQAVYEAIYQILQKLSVQQLYY